MTLTGITIWRPADVTEMNLPILRRARPDFVSVKAVDTTRKFHDKAVGQLLARLFEVGQAYHLWGWHELHGREQAILEAHVVADCVNRYGAQDYHVNAEKKWLKQGTKQARANMVVFIEKLRELTNARLWGNTFSRGMDTELASIFDVWEPMCYGTRPKTMKWQMERRLGKFSKALPELNTCPMIGTGRVDAKGNVWGWWKDKGGWLELLTKHDPYAVNFFRWPLNAEGNKHNPPVGEQIAELVMAQERLLGCT